MCNLLFDLCVIYASNNSFSIVGSIPTANPLALISLTNASTLKLTDRHISSTPFKTIQKLFLKPKPNHRATTT